MCLQRLKHPWYLRRSSDLASMPSAPLSAQRKHCCSIGVIPSIACVSVQSTYSWLWGQLTLLFFFCSLSPRYIYLYYKKVSQTLCQSSPRGFILLNGVSRKLKLEAGPLAFWPSLERRRRRKKSWSFFFFFGKNSINATNENGPVELPVPGQNEQQHWHPLLRR